MANPALAAPPHSIRRPILFIDAQHGLCNRLRAMTSAATIAEASGRELVVIWCPDHHCEARLPDLLDYNGPYIEQRNTADALRDACPIRYNYMEIEGGAHHEEAILPPDETSDIFIRSAYSLISPLTDFPREQHFLRALRPSAAVVDLVASVPHPNPIAAHIRMGSGDGFEHLSYEAPENWPAERQDELNEWRKKSNVGRFIARFDELIAAGEADSIFVAADLERTYELLQDRYGARIRYLRRDLFDRSPEQLVYALADLLLLTAAPRFLASTWSSFSDIAQRLARPGRKIEQSGTDF